MLAFKASAQKCKRSRKCQSKSHGQTVTKRLRNILFPLGGAPEIFLNNNTIWSKEMRTEESTLDLASKGLSMTFNKGAVSDGGWGEVWIVVGDTCVEIPHS